MILGKYRILKPLGKGGEGSVWLAVHVETEQMWALKVIARRDGLREYHELKMLRRLRHRSLPVMADLIETEDEVCLVMEYVRGPSLRQLMDQNSRWKLQEIIDIGLMICEVLEYLHGRKQPVFHLDVKPDNILLDYSGRCKLVDFGAAVKGNGHSRLGTEGYAAPEQYVSGSNVDGRADLYALGAVLYEMVSGIRYAPFMEKSRVPGCPGALETIIKTCLHPDPGKRYPNARCLREQLLKLQTRKKRETVRLPVYPAILLILLSGTLALAGLGRELQNRTSAALGYEKLIARAFCEKDEKSFDSLREAQFLSPGRSEAYLAYIEMAEEDGIFSDREEENLRALLNGIPVGSGKTYEELLKEHPENYALVCWRTALLYWFESSLEESRRISAGWMKKAADALENISDAEKSRPEESWKQSLRVFYVMSACVGRLEEGGEEFPEYCERAVRFWEQLQILTGAGLLQPLDMAMQLRFISEVCDTLTFILPVCLEEGVSKAEVMSVLTEFEMIISEAEESGKGHLRTMAQSADEQIGKVRESMESG